MPHFTLEYSANLDSRVDMQAVVEVVRKAAVETGIFPLGGIRVRAIRCEHSAVADGAAHFGFLDMVLRLGEGRDLATRKKAGEYIFKVLSAYLDQAARDFPAQVWEGLAALPLMLSVRAGVRAHVSAHSGDLAMSSGRPVSHNIHCLPWRIR